MKDIAARELKGHNILAVERFWDSTFWMIEFTVLRPTAYGEPGDEMRLFLTEDGYQSALQSQQRREIKIKRYTQGSKEDGEKDAIDCLMEDTVSRTHRHREYYNNYQRYQLMQVDKERVIMACNIIINDLIGRLYRYDYRFGYDITLASEHSIAKKLSDNWQNEWEAEDDEI